MKLTRSLTHETHSNYKKNIQSIKSIQPIKNIRHLKSTQCFESYLVAIFLRLQYTVSCFLWCNLQNSDLILVLQLFVP